ncbi:MAG: hypothetical protein AMXMBFR33_02180 [Candidatus Xenobia bacterium]
MGPRTWPIDARLAIVSRPRQREDVAEMGVRTLVCLLTREEREELGLLSERSWCESAGIGYLELPIADRGLPSRQALLELAGQILAREAPVGIHCRAGIGRSAVVAAAVLILEGVAPRRALELIEQARGCSVPDTDEQRDLVLSLRPPG